MKRKTTKKRGKKTPVRKIPKQERSQRRFESIVDAAAEAFASFGFEATTMEGIAARAGTSIGSVYQFFPNKTAVFREVAQRAIEGSGKTFAKLMVLAASGAQWGALLDAACDLYFDLHLRDPMTQAVVRNFELYREFEAEDAAQMERFIAVVGQFLAGWSPTLEGPHRNIVARALVYTFGTSMLIIASQEPQTAPAMLEEIKLMLRSYLGAYLD